MLSKIIGVVTGLPPWLQYMLVGAALIVALWAANKWEDALVAKQAATEANAISDKHTMEAIDGLSSKAEANRAKLAYCDSTGRMYNFASNTCYDDTSE